MDRGITISRVASDGEGPVLVQKILADCADGLTLLHGKGFWSAHPSLDRIRKGCDRKSVYLAYVDGIPVGTFAIDAKAPAFMPPRFFTEPNAPSAYLTDMGVTPASQRIGVGRWCLDQLPQLLKARNFKYCRLDAYDAPAGAGNFYRKCGYSLAARHIFHGVALLLFEKRIDLV